MRGKGGRTGSSGRYTGITPAYAGKRQARPGQVGRLRDHPRMCGEKLKLKKNRQVCKGSPPRMRGKEVQGLLQDLVGGITPAYAGKSLWCAQGQAQERDHPRVCEEKNFLLLMTSRRSGSPPRVRGKGHVCHCSLVCCRITPACAGKSLLRVVGQCYEPGITPARAGKRTSDAAGIAFWWDHPRVCGEKSSSSSRLSCASGSPPRMRGKESGCVPGLPGSRITPAHAGKRDKTAIFEEWCRDHPCVCGEKTKPVPAGGILMGSPPRVRGKAVAQGAHVLAAGITPAYAGKRLHLHTA